MNKLIVNILMIGMLIGIGLNPAYATTATENKVTVSEEKEVKERGKIISSKYLCNEKCFFNPEAEHSNSGNNERIYKRKIEIKRIFEELKENDQKAKASLDFNVTFTYDKKSFVKVEASDVSSSANSKDWKIRENTEIHPGKDVILVSNRYVIYKKGSIGIGDHIMEGYADLLCSRNGNIGLNTNLS